MSEGKVEITKTLSRNDLGQTGSHQAGILVPKQSQILSYFPSLDASVKNPRTSLKFFDPDQRLIELSFIYYNNGRFGGTRDEYRLTRLTRYLRETGLKPGDQLLFGHDAVGRYTLGYTRRHSPTEANRVRLASDGGWQVVRI